MVAFQSLKDYGPTFQIKVISSLLKNKAFLLNVRDIIDESHFEHPGIKWTLTETIKYFDKYHCCPTLDTLKIEVKKMEKSRVEITGEIAWEKLATYENEALKAIRKTCLLQSV